MVGVMVEPPPPPPGVLVTEIEATSTEPRIVLELVETKERDGKGTRLIRGE